MIPYIEMGALFRNSICFWAILLILGFVLNLSLFIKQRRYSHVVIAFIYATFTYFVMQICRNISCYHVGKRLYPVAGIFGELPYIAYLLILLGISVMFCIQLRSCIEYSRTHITPKAVKEAFDQNPTGICYYLENGQIILSNHTMNALAFAITGRALLNGLEFFEDLNGKNIAELADGRVVRFSHRPFLLDGDACVELIADDITEIYRKSETLREENERLKTQNQRMKEYGETIDETVRRQEVLNTKTNIHDEMNRLLLSTDHVIRVGTEEEKQKMLKTWQKNILLLCMEADSGAKNNALSDLESLSKVIGVAIVYDKLPETEDATTLQLFSMAVEEAMTNAAKHGSAKTLYVQMKEDVDALTAIITNDGKSPEGNLSEGGGLSSLRLRLEQMGGKIEVSNEAQFALTVVIPKGGKQNVL